MPTCSSTWTSAVLLPEAGIIHTPAAASAYAGMRIADRRLTWDEVEDQIRRFIAP